MSVASILFDFDDDHLREDAPFHALLIGLAGDGWRFLKKAIVCDDSPGDVYVPSAPETLMNAWKNAKRAAPRYGGGTWMEMENADDLKLSWGIDPRQPRRVNLAIDTAILRRRDQAPNARALAAVGEAIYTHLRPAYGYGLFSYDAHTPESPGTGIRAIWDYNFLSPALVETIGVDKLAYLPAWRADKLPDGGMVIEMAANPIAEAPAYTQYYRHAATTLGIPFHQGAS